MNILYLTPYSIEDSIIQSGTVVNIKKCLEYSGNKVLVIDNLKINIIIRIFIKLIKSITKKEFDLMRIPIVLRSFEKQISRKKKNLEYDIIFSTTSILCAYIKDDKPCVFYTDSTYGGMINYYSNKSKWVEKSIKYSIDIENKALENCTKAIYASNWAISTAIKYHNADNSKCVAINRGANIYHSFTTKDIYDNIKMRTINNNNDKIYKMLFVGRDWNRKGGDIALEIVKLLSQKGYLSRLLVVGCEPDLSEDDRKYVEIIGFLDKENIVDNNRLKELYITSDLYLQPSRMEAQGIAYAEASAFALPIIATNTGGVSDIVTDENGLLFEVDDNIEIYVDRIIKLLIDLDKYIELCISSYEFYNKQLNWNSVGIKLTNLLEQIVYDN